MTTQKHSENCPVTRYGTNGRCNCKATGIVGDTHKEEWWYKWIDDDMDASSANQQREWVANLLSTQRQAWKREVIKALEEYYISIGIPVEAGNTPIEIIKVLNEME